LTPASTAIHVVARPAPGDKFREEAMMSREENEDNTIYKVVVNHEEQYSIWPADRENPLGWNDAGKSGTKAECLAYIEEVWTDMRPLSLRKKMEENARSDEQ
jgi:MbtH protein